MDLLSQPRAIKGSNSVLHDLREALRVEAGAAHQGAIDLLLRHECGTVFRLHAAAIEDAHALRDGIAEGARGDATHGFVRARGNLRGGGFARSDRPDRLVRNYDGRGVLS